MAVCLVHQRRHHHDCTTYGGESVEWSGERANPPHWGFVAKLGFKVSVYSCFAGLLPSVHLLRMEIRNSQNHVGGMPLSTAGTWPKSPSLPFVQPNWVGGGVGVGDDEGSV